MIADRDLASRYNPLDKSSPSVSEPDYMRSANHPIQ